MSQESPPPYVIEAARSGRSKCKTCRRPIGKGALRIGILVEGFYGPGHMWHHLSCAARRRPEEVGEAYRLRAWNEAKFPPSRVPPLDELQAGGKKPEARRQLPYAEAAPSGRSNCKRCGKSIAEGETRIIVGREVRFGQQIRTSPVKIHPGCLRDELQSDECSSAPEGFSEALRSNSPDLTPDRLDRLFREIGDL